MKICWDNLEKLHFCKKSGRWYKNRIPYIYKEFCKCCNQPFLAHLQKTEVLYCSLSCQSKSKIISKEYRKKMSDSHLGEKNHNFGKHKSEETRKRISISNIGKKASKETKKKLSESHMGERSSAWKGGYASKNIPLYNTYSPQIDWCEPVRKDPEDNNILQIKCTYCGKWHTPTINSIRSRLKFLNGKSIGEHRFYCSKGCKLLCPIFHKKLYSAEESNTKKLSREAQPELRQMVLARDNYTCIKCGSAKWLQCHHTEGIRWEPLESADIDKCITVCVNCHNRIHNISGCTRIDMRCNTI